MFNQRSCKSALIVG